MARVIIFGPVVYRSTCDSEATSAEAYCCHLCGQKLGVDVPYLFWFKGNTYASKDLRRAHLICFNTRYPQ